MDIAEDTQCGYKHKRHELSSPINVLHVDDDPYILEVSKNILEMHGTFEIDTASSVDEAINKIENKSYNVILSDYEMPGKDGLILLQMINERLLQLPFIIFTGKGREEVVIKALNLGAFRYINKHGDPETVYTELAASIKQATQHVKSQSLIRESEERYHSLFSTMKEGIVLHKILYDPQGKPIDYVILDVNPAFEAITGIKKETAVGKKATELYGVPEPPYLDIYAKTAATGEPSSFETYFAPMKKYFSISSFSPAKSKFATIFFDITQIKENEKALKATMHALSESEERWATTLSSIGDAVIATDKCGKITFINVQAEKLTGWTMQESLQQPINKVFHIVNEYTRKVVEDPVAKVLKTGVIVGLANHTVLVRKDGSEVPIDDSGAPIKDTDGKSTGVVLVFRDVTERKKAEDNLRESEEKFRSLAEESPNMIFINRKGQVVYANKKCEDVMGYKREEFYSPNFNFLSLVAPESIELLKSAFAKHMKGEEVAPYEYNLITKDGCKIEAEINTKLIVYEEENAILGVITDISERKKAEKAAEKHLENIEMMNEKLRVIGGLTRHDARNKLSIIVGNAFLLKKAHSGQPDVMEAASKIETVVREIDKIFEFSRMYEQLGIEELTMIDASKAFDEAAAQFPELDIKMKNKCTGLAVLADSFLKRLFFSLIDNTAKHGKKATSINVYCNKADENKLELIFEDNGIGIPVENKNRLYEPGFSTANSSGYGLYLIKRMIELYGWNIQETGIPGKGAKFVITIPKTNREGKTNYTFEDA